MNYPYLVSYVLKSAIQDGKYEIEDIEVLSVRDTDALRAANSVKRALVDDQIIESAGDVKIIEVKIGI